MTTEQLIFVYNASGDLFSSLTDFAHKLLSPATYSCSLCALTHGHLAMKTEWKTFIAQLPVSIIFLHKDQFNSQFSTMVALPAVFMLNKNGLQPLIAKAELDNLPDVGALKQLVLNKLSGYVQHHHSYL